MFLISPIETEFRLQYGCYPYEYYIKWLQYGYTSEEAFAKLQAAMDKIWEDMKFTSSMRSVNSHVGDVYEANLSQHISNQIDYDFDDDSGDYYFNYIVGSYNPFLEEDN